MQTSEKRAETIKSKLMLKMEREIRAKALKSSGYSNSDIAKTIGISEGAVRNLLKEQKEPEDDKV